MKGDIRQRMDALRDEYIEQRRDEARASTPSPEYVMSLLDHFEYELGAMSLSIDSPYADAHLREVYRTLDKVRGQICELLGDDPTTSVR